MQKRQTFIACFFCALMSLSWPVFAQIKDSAWFEKYFERANYRRELRFADALDSLEIVRQLAVDARYDAALCRYHIERATIFLSRNMIDSAINSFQTAIALARSTGSDRQLANAYMGLANLHQYNGNTLLSAENYLEAIKLLKQQKRTRALVGLYKNLYGVHGKIKQKNGAIQKMLAAMAESNTKEDDLVELFNTGSSEDVGLVFADQSLIKEVNTDIIYVIFGGAKFVISDANTLGHYGAPRDVQRIPAGTLQMIPDFPRNGSILMELTGDPKVYLAKNDTLYHIENTDVLDKYGSWDAVYFVPTNALNGFPKSKELVTLDNVNTTFDINREYDNLADSIQAALSKNKTLSLELSQKVADRNQSLQNRKLLLWASGIGLIALLLIVLLLIRNFRQKQKLSEQAIHVLKAEEEVKHKMGIERERTRIATDMHDDLGAGLSRIKFLSETIGIKKQKLEPIEEDISSIRQYSADMIDKMGEIVWALNEKNDSLIDLLGYTRAYSAEYLSGHGIACTLQMPSQVPAIHVSGEFRRNIYLCVKEILHNVVKHAEASKVILKMNISDGLDLDISDNGKGFKREEMRKYSNGISNIEKRIKDIGGKIDILSSAGTRYKITVPFPL